MKNVIQWLKNVVAWLLKNTAQIVGILESFAKLFAGIASVTPTKVDDALIPVVDKIASQIKKYLYQWSDQLAGKV